MLAGALSTLALWVSWLYLPGIELGVDDVTASEITASGYAKGSDYVIAVIVTLSAAISAAATYRRAMPPNASVSARHRSADGVVFVAVAMVVAVIAVAAPGDRLMLADRLFSGPFRWGTFSDSVTGWARLASTAAIGWLAARLLNRAYHRPNLVTTPGFWASPILAFYVALVAGTLAALTARIGALGLTPSGSVTAASVAGVVALEWALRRPHETVRRANSAMQLAVPLVLVLPLVRTVRIEGAVVLVGGTRPAAAALAVVAVVTGVQARVLRRDGSERLEWGYLVTPVTTGVVAVAAMAGFLPVSSGLAIGDMFHTGEQLVQWPQLEQHGRIPYADSVPVPGGWPTLVGAFAATLWDSTVAGLSYATGVGLAAIAFVCGMLLHRVVGAQWALPAAYALGTFGLPQMDRYLLAAAYMLLLSWPTLLRRPRLWLLMWVPASIVGVAAMPATVAPAVGASVPIAGWLGVTIWRTRGRGHWTRSRVVTAGLLLTLTVVTVPYGFVVAEAVLREGSANATAWGLGLRHSRERLMLKLGFDAVRLAGWTFGTATFVVLGQSLRATRRGASRVGPSSSEALVVLGLGYILFSIPYAWGRIDEWALSRAGATTVLITVFVVTWALLSVPDRGLRRRAGGGWLLVTVAAVSALGPFSPTRVLANASMVRELGEHVRPTGSEATGRGLGYYEPGVAQQLDRFQEVVQEAIGDGTYFDAVNSSALFAVTGRRIIGSYPSAIYAASAYAQHSLVDAFRSTPPAAALIAAPAQGLPGLPSDMPFSLRSYRPYRWLIEQGYVGMSGDGYLFLVPDNRGDRVPQSWLDAPTGGQEPLLLPVRDATVADVLQPSELGMLAATWGASSDEILSRMAPGFLLTGRPTGSGTRFDTPVLGAPVPDFLAVRLDCTGARADARYRTSQGPEDWVVFEAIDGEHMLPLGTDPRWLRTSSSPRWIEIDVGASAACDVATAAEAHRLVD